ncbi:MAG TPA: hypothetical protein VF748_06180 [Candidatus Acidoferrum sp.]
MFTFLLGPFLAVLPRRWRQSLPLLKSVNWRAPCLLSGFGELVVAIVAYMYWYSYSMNTWVSRGLDAALAGKMDPRVTDHDITIMSLFIFATSPLTWAILCVGLEGSVRLLGAAFSESDLGVLPLFVLDKIFLKIAGRDGPGIAQAAGYTETNLSSYVGAIHDQVRISRALHLPDELCHTREDADEFLEIRACRSKPDWTPPRTVRYKDRFYRLENSSRGSGARPFRYRLRRLSAGVMSRTVLVYAPEEEPVVSEK